MLNTVDFFQMDSGRLAMEMHLLLCGKRNVDLNFIFDIGVKCQKLLPKPGSTTWDLLAGMKNVA